MNFCPYSWECSEKFFILQTLLFSHVSCPCLKYGRSVEEPWFNVFFYPLAMAPHSSTLAWRIPWMEEPGRLPSMGSLESDTTEWLHFHFSLSCIGEGNGNPLQCSCLENPRDGGAWWAAVYGVTQSWTRLKRLSSSEFEQKKSLSKPTQNPLPNEIPRRGN